MPLVGFTSPRVRMARSSDASIQIGRWLNCSVRLVHSNDSVSFLLLSFYVTLHVPFFFFPLFTSLVLLERDLCRWHFAERLGRMCHIVHFPLQSNHIFERIESRLMVNRLSTSFLFRNHSIPSRRSTLFLDWPITHDPCPGAGPGFVPGPRSHIP